MNWMCGKIHYHVDMLSYRMLTTHATEVLFRCMHGVLVIYIDVQFSRYAMQSPLSVSTTIPYPYPVSVMSIDTILVRHTPCCTWRASKAPVDAFYIVMQCAP
jgi:hypothetical protein